MVQFNACDPITLILISEFEEVDMSRSTALITSAVFTLFLLVVMGLVVVWNTRAAATPSSQVAEDGALAATSEDQSAAYQARIEQAQTAMAEREAQYQARLDELTQMAQEREAEYKARLSEAESQMTTYQAQIDQTRQATAAYRDQIAQLQQALNERNNLFETRRAEFEAQRQERLGQLQARLDEGETKLQEANAQLGR
jgi:chromosome segregation ATPase